jgi:hypothetical protein
LRRAVVIGALGVVFGDIRRPAALADADWARGRRPVYGDGMHSGNFGAERRRGARIATLLLNPMSFR